MEPIHYSYWIIVFYFLGLYILTQNYTMCKITCQRNNVNCI